jgi:hypothetical protein
MACEPADAGKSVQLQFPQEGSVSKSDREGGSYKSEETTLICDAGLICSCDNRTCVPLCAGLPGSSSVKGSSLADVYKGELTPLQRHVAFFDRDKDGVIYASETYEGFRAIGAGVPLSAFSALFINGLLGPKTIPVCDVSPDPFSLSGSDRC